MDNVTTLTRKELSDKYNISKWRWDPKNKSALMDFLKDYMDIEEVKVKNNYVYTITGEVPEILPAFPRNTNKKEKTDDYEEFVKENLPTEPTLESKVNMSTKAIKEMGNKKWGHYSSKSVARRYVGPAMEKYGEKSDYTVWAQKDAENFSYREMTAEEVEDLKHCFRTVNLPPEEWAERYKEVMEDEEEYYRQASLFKQALDMFYDTHHFMPVLVRRWMIKRQALDSPNRLEVV